MVNRLIAGLLLLLLVLPAAGLAEGADTIWETDEVIETPAMLFDPVFTATPPPPMLEEREDVPHEPTAREDMIERIIALGEKLYRKANGKPQRAQYSGDIYVCKNFTVYLFRQNRDDFRMAEYPDATLVIPNNMPAKGCKPYSYGLMWEEVSAEKGNPFYAAAEFRYDTALSKEENMELALAFMKQVRRGDYFQMSANYYYGVGAHSAIMISDYDPVTGTVHWMDSNMRGTKKNGERYGYVQFDEEKEIEWWAEAFCQKSRGATLYRLRDDIIYAPEAKK